MRRTRRNTLLLAACLRGAASLRTSVSRPRVAPLCGGAAGHVDVFSDAPVASGDSSEPPLYYVAEELYPRSYVLASKRFTTSDTRAQWLADWRAITECFARFPVEPDRGQAGLAAAVNAACADELAFITGGPLRAPSPFAFALIDDLFVSARCDPDRYARLRTYCLWQYVPGRFGDVSERVGSARVAEAARTNGGYSRECFQRTFDPATPEYDAMVRCHDVEYPVKHPAWRAGGGGLPPSPCD